MIQTIGIVSLSRGILGEDFLHHELDLGLARLKEFGVRVKFLPHALDGLESLAAHPEHRAQDLLDAFRDPEIDAIIRRLVQKYPFAEIGAFQTRKNVL